MASDLGKRIAHVTKAYALSNRALGKIAGLSGQAIGDVIEGKQKSLKFIYLKAISEKLDISIDWLLEGVGEDPMPKWEADKPPMVLNGAGEKKQTGYSKDQSLNRESTTLTMYPVTAAAGYMNVYSNNPAKQYPQIILTPDYYDCDSAFEVEGDSMYPKFSNGDKVACRKVKQARYIRPGEPYIIDYGDGFVLKRVFDSADPEKIKLISDNSNYPPYEVLRSDIIGIWFVKGVITKNTGAKTSYESSIMEIKKELIAIGKKLKEKKTKGAG